VSDISDSSWVWTIGPVRMGALDLCMLPPRAYNLIPVVADPSPEARIDTTGGGILSRFVSDVNFVRDARGIPTLPHT
jgi:hypothetical protein